MLTPYFQCLFQFNVPNGSHHIPVLLRCCKVKRFHYYYYTQIFIIKRELEHNDTCKNLLI